MKKWLFVLLLLFFCLDVWSKIDPKAVASIIEDLRKENRGPYKDIRWFCEDGSIIDPKAKCPGEGNQHARLRDEVKSLADREHLYLTQILTGTSISDFWDADRQHSRMIQYQLEQYLFNVDQGWINETGQYYRGAKQVEDETEWAREFFTKILESKDNLTQKFLLIRRAARDINHGVDNDITKSVRALSLDVSELDAKFQPIRVKIHGLPQQSDIKLVETFVKEHKISVKTTEKISALLEAMKQMYARNDTALIRTYLQRIPREHILDQALKDYIAAYRNNPSPALLLEKAVDLQDLVRTEAPYLKTGAARLAMIDLSNLLEDIIGIQSNKWEAKTLQANLDKLCLLNTSLKAGGYIQEWEWHLLAEPQGRQELSMAELEYQIETYRKAIQWGTSMVYALYRDEVGTWVNFEPKAAGFNDDIIRSSPCLAMGQSLDDLYSFFVKEANIRNTIFDLGSPAGVKGVNPGFAKGVLQVINDFEDNPYLDPSKIYMFNSPPKELKPLAGIATVTEGNTVSHVQLLARNLGIPNAAIPIDLLSKMKKFHGKEIFYAVSNKGSVIMKLVSDMTGAEQALFTDKNIKREKITISLDKLQLDQTNILNIRHIDARASGVLCGPKAANLAQLKNIFPDKVVEGFVIPFGIFKDHMDQQIPNTSTTYWQMIQEVLYSLKKIEDEGTLTQDSLDRLQNAALMALRETIAQIPLKPKFVQAVRDSFQRVLRGSIGTVPVFLRSDTNMEDLKEFTGAGLNLTLFNVLAEHEIMQGIKNVWASPFSERSYKWRQKYLDNPENIYPSILVIPSVDVDKSGVLITKGIANNNPVDLTIAFSQGAGGAVDGQSAETYLAHQKARYTLISPSRETVFKQLPVTGGTISTHKTPGKMTMGANDLKKIKALAEQIRAIMPKYGMEGPYDVELGLKDGEIWLFQIRPFVENKNAVSSAYLQSITPIIDYSKNYKLNHAL